MKITSRLLAVSILLLLVSQLGAQVKMTRRVEAEGFFMIPELGAAVLQNKDTLRVDMISPESERPKEFASVDLREGDLILLFNGKRLVTAEAMEAAYKILKVGDAIQLGIKRKDGLHLVNFKKADESTLPKRKMMMMKVDDKDSSPDAKVFPDKAVHKIEGDDVTLVASAGLILSRIDGKTVVASTLPLPGLEIIEGAFSEGDVLSSVNDRNVDDPQHAKDIIESLNLDDTVKCLVLRGDKAVPVSFVKSAVQPQVIIKRK